MKRKYALTSQYSRRIARRERGSRVIPLDYIEISNQNARRLNARGLLHLTALDRFVNRGAK